MALVWRELRHWAVIASSPAPPGRAGSPASPSAGWRLLATGSGCCAAWDLRGQAVALSSMPPMAAVRTEQAKKKEAREQMETAER